MKIEKSNNIKTVGHEKMWVVARLNAKGNGTKSKTIIMFKEKRKWYQAMQIEFFKNRIQASFWMDG